MSTNYGRYRSPIQIARQKTGFREDKQHPARQEIERSIGTFNFVAEVHEDIQTLTEMSHVEGLVAFICILKRDGRVLSQGRGSSVVYPGSKYTDRAVHSAFNSSISDAVIKATRVLDTLHPISQTALVETPQAKGSTTFEPATEKQLQCLSKLIANVRDVNERTQLQARLVGITKSEASRMIESLGR